MTHFVYKMSKNNEKCCYNVFEPKVTNSNVLFCSINSPKYKIQKSFKSSHLRNCNQPSFTFFLIKIFADEFLLNNYLLQLCSRYRIILIIAALKENELINHLKQHDQWRKVHFWGERGLWIHFACTLYFLI